MNIPQLETTFFIFILSMARITAAFALIPYLSKSSLGSSMVRNGVAASLCLFLYPIVDHSYQQQAIVSWYTFTILLKEVVLGIVLGFVVNIPFWAIESVGFFIDNQRGSTMASSINPLSGTEASPLGILLFQTLVTLFFISGSFLVLLAVLYKSYVVWPIFDFYPSVSEAWVGFFISQLDLLMQLMMLLAGPVIIGMFLSEFGLALISRFAPQLNVFILSMPIKSAVAMAILTIYIGAIILFFGDHLADAPLYFDDLFGLLGD